MKIGTKVKVVRGSINYGIGRYAGSVKKTNGEWCQVNFAEPRKTPNIRNFRPANLNPV